MARQIALVSEHASLADVAIIVPSTDTQHIQELQPVLIHLLCALVEERCATGSEVQAPVIVMLTAGRIRERKQIPALRRRSHARTRL